MRPSGHRYRSARYAGGFTLIELLVTIVIIAIAVSFVLPQLSWIPSTPQLEKELRQFSSMLELARDEAALQGRNLGIRFYPDHYVFLELEPELGTWIDIEEDDMLTRQPFSEQSLPGVFIEDRRIELEPPEEEEDSNTQLVNAAGQTVTQANVVPHIVILASGEVTPFVLELETLGSDEYANVAGDFLGQLELTTTRE